MNVILTAIIVLFLLGMTGIAVIYFMTSPASTNILGSGTSFSAFGLSPNIGVGVYDVNSNLLSVITDSTTDFALYKVNDVENVYKIKINGQICSVNYDGAVAVTGYSNSQPIRSGITDATFGNVLGKDRSGRTVIALARGECVSFITNEIVLDDVMTQTSITRTVGQDKVADIQAYFKIDKLTQFDVTTGAYTSSGSIKSNVIKITIYKHPTNIQATIGIEPPTSAVETTTTIPSGTTTTVSGSATTTVAPAGNVVIIKSISVTQTTSSCQVLTSECPCSTYSICHVKFYAIGSKTSYNANYLDKDLACGTSVSKGGSTLFSGDKAIVRTFTCELTGTPK